MPPDGGKFPYLATVIDFASRRLTGWATADHMRTELVTDTLAVAKRAHGSRTGVIMHTSGVRSPCTVPVAGTGLLPGGPVRPFRLALGWPRAQAGRECASVVGRGSARRAARLVSAYRCGVRGTRPWRELGDLPRSDRGRKAV
ncbi:hypothetical protein [Streptomyces flavotricini]|uniref:hypothetical protein n=1 Tax=Streptomyces flavotricini TaxID=66888 RepID=UPI0035592876